MAEFMYSEEFDFSEDDDSIRPKKKRENRRRWREIEKFKEQRRLSKELAQNDAAYYDFLEDF